MGVAWYIQKAFEKDFSVMYGSWGGGWLPAKVVKPATWTSRCFWSIFRISTLNPTQVLVIRTIFFGAVEPPQNPQSGPNQGRKSMQHRPNRGGRCWHPSHTSVGCRLALVGDQLEAQLMSTGGQLTVSTLNPFPALFCSKSQVLGPVLGPKPVDLTQTWCNQARGLAGPTIPDHFPSVGQILYDTRSRSRWGTALPPNPLAVCRLMLCALPPQRIPNGQACGCPTRPRTTNGHSHRLRWDSWVFDWSSGWWLGVGLGPGLGWAHLPSAATVSSFCWTSRVGYDSLASYGPREG